MTSPVPPSSPSCEAAAAALAARLTGDASRGEEASLAAHLEGCAACREEERRLQVAWAALDDGATTADFAPSARFSDATLDRMTREILARRPEKVVPIRPLRAQGSAFPLLPALAWAASVLLAAGLGWGAGRSGGSSDGRSGGSIGGSTGGSTGGTVRPVPASASATFSGAEVVPVSTGALVPVARVEPQQLSESVVYILVKTLREDRNPGVRKKAAEALAALPPSPELRDAFAGVLSTERNPAIRIVAVEALARSAKETRDPMSVEVLRERASDRRESGFVRSRAAGALAGLAL